MKKTKKISFLKLFFSLILIGLGLGVLFSTLVIVSALKNLPSLDLIANRQITESTKIYDRTGEVLLFEIYDEERRTLIPFEEIPQRSKQATVAIEDANFYNHSALDFRGLLRAILVNAKSGRKEQGGSTITQQLAKNAFLTPEKTLVRKIKELIIAYRLEQVFTKDEILTLYLNQIPYGSNAYGIESASQTFFSKPIGEISLAEAALLASLPQSPSYYSPWGSHLDELLARKNLVLEQMRQAEYITPEEYELALSQEIEFTRPENFNLAQHFIIHVKEYLDQTYGEDFVRRGGLTVITTLDIEMQKIAENAVSVGAKRNEDLYNGKNAALVAQEPKTGKIRALVGSRDYFEKEIDGNFNVATQGLRQPGSTLKPFAYLAALEKGLTDKTIFFDVDTEFNTTNNAEESYRPANYDGDFRGPVNIRTALAQSINVPAVKTLYIVGIQNFLSFLESFGIKTLNDPRRYGLSLVLGGGEVKLVDLVGAYATLAQEGVYHKQHFLEEVRDQNGEILEQYKDITKKVLEPENPRIINNILSDLVVRGGLFQSSLSLTIFPGHDVALKTGTTNDYRDAWSVGYTPNIVVGVWAGNSDNEPMQQRGGSILAAVPILSDFLGPALKNVPAQSFPQPEEKNSSIPMVNGEYIAYYQTNGVISPQIHSLLFYLEKAGLARPSEKQLENWESATLLWAINNIPDFASGINYNHPLTADSFLVTETSQQNPEQIQIISPSNKNLIGNSIDLNFSAATQDEVVTIKILFNGQSVENQTGSFGKIINYHRTVLPNNIQDQNVLTIILETIRGEKILKEISLSR